MRSNSGTFKKVSTLNRWFTGKSMSEALIFVSTNPQYDNRLLNELPVQYMKIQSSEHGENMMRTTFVHNMFSPGLSLEF